MAATLEPPMNDGIRARLSPLKDSSSIADSNTGTTSTAKIETPGSLQVHVATLNCW